MVRQLVYVSSATGRLGPDALADVLRVSCRNNAAAGVTGALVHHQGNLMQALEGPADAVGATYARIEADPRHHDLIRLLDEPADARAYPDWAMGVLHPERVPDACGCVRSLFDLTTPGPERARRLLHGFRALVEP